MDVWVMSASSCQYDYFLQIRIQVLHLFRTCTNPQTVRWINQKT